MSDLQDLQWLLLRKNNSFLVKRVVEGPVFSKEAGNLRNVNSFKFSGLANNKTIHVADSGSGIQITTSKKVDPRQVASGKSTSTIRPHSGSRRAFGVVAGKAKHGYRSDLRTATLARVSALLLAQKPVKASPPLKLRSKKSKAPKAVAPAKASAPAAEDEDDDDLPDLE